MNSSAVYLLDSNVLIEAKNSYYAFDICPGFGDSIIRAHVNARARSIDHVRSELLAGHPAEDLVHWVRSIVPATFFHSTNATEVLAAYREITSWVQRHAQYLDRAKARFATGADGWLVAYSMVYGTIVTTNEQPRPEARNSIQLPDVCAQFNVSYCNTFAMLREIGVTLHAST